MNHRIGVLVAAIVTAPAAGQGPALPESGTNFATASAPLSPPQPVAWPTVAPAPATVAPVQATAPTTITPTEAKPPTLEELGKKVETLSKNLTVTTGDEHFKLVLGGAVTADFLYSTRRPVAPGTPFFMPPASIFGFDSQTFDATARQTALFGQFTGPDVFDFKTGGFVLVTLYDNSIVADLYGLLPINAYGELKNDDWRFAAGLQLDVFNPLNPTVLPFSLLGASGNTGFFRGQLRVEAYIRPAEDVQVTLTASLGEPIPTTLNDQLRISEDNGLPNLDVRAAVGLGPVQGAGMAARRPIEFGLSAVCGQLRTTDPLGPRQVVTDVRGLGVDARWAADPSWGVQGEGYIAQGMGTYGTSALTSINPTTFEAIQSAGMWIEGYYYWCPEMLHTHIGYGIDDPRNIDAGATLPVCNQTYYATTIWDVTKAFRVGFQVSYLKTNYSLLKDNEAFIFHTQFQWKF